MSDGEPGRRQGFRSVGSLSRKDDHPDRVQQRHAGRYCPQLSLPHGGRPPGGRCPCDHGRTAPCGDPGRHGACRPLRRAGLHYADLTIDGCIVTTAGVDPAQWVFRGAASAARVTESQEEALEAILSGRIAVGDVVVVRYEGPRGGPGVQEMLYPTSFLEGRGLGKSCALITDGRFSDGTSGLAIGHISTEAAAGGAIGLIQTGDLIEIHIPARSITVQICDVILTARRQARESRGWRPAHRDRPVSAALRAYAAMASSPDKGAIRDISPTSCDGCSTRHMATGIHPTDRTSL